MRVGPTSHLPLGHTHTHHTHGHWDPRNRNPCQDFYLEYLKGRGLLVVTYKMHYVGTTFTLKMNSNDKILRDDIVNKQHINLLKIPQKFDWSRSSPTTLTSSPIWVIGISHFFHIGRLWGFKCKVPSTLYVCAFWILNSNLLAPHTSGPRDVPRCGALSLLQKDAALQGGVQQKPL